MYVYKYILLSLLLGKSSTRYCSIPRKYTKAYFPPSSNDYFPRLRMMESLGPLQEFTVCSWIRPHSLKNDAYTILSYAAHNEHEIGMALKPNKTDTKICMCIGNQSQEFSCSRTDWKVGRWYHLCARWFSSDGTLKVTVNSRSCTANSLRYATIYEGKTIEEGGVFVVGQKQIDTNSKFDFNTSWHGDITDMQMWNEALDDIQIRDIGKCQGKRKTGNVMSFMKTPMRVEDGVVLSETALCQS